MAHNNCRLLWNEYGTADSVIRSMSPNHDDQVRGRLAMQTAVNECSRTKLHTFSRVEPVKLVSHELRQTTIEFPRVFVRIQVTGFITRCSSLVTASDVQRGTVVDAAGDKYVGQCCSRGITQRVSSND
jgi:hypothetical protein